jgi:hypothetical protein
MACDLAASLPVRGEEVRLCSTGLVGTRMQRSKSRSKEESAALEVRATAALAGVLVSRLEACLRWVSHRGPRPRCRVHAAVASPAYPETRRMNYVHDQSYSMTTLYHEQDVVNVKE